MDINIKKITDGFYEVDEGLVRCFLLEGDDEAVLIDSGVVECDLSSYLATVTDKPVKKVLTTHSDRDHTACHQSFCAYMHPSDFAHYRAHGGEKNDAPLPLYEGDTIDIGDFHLEVILIPGHTPGSIAFLEREKRFLISGDTIGSREIFMFGEDRSLDAYILSLKKLKNLSGLFDVIYTSHGELMLGTDIIDELLNGASALLAGQLIGENKPPYPAKIYSLGRAHFLYDM